MSEYAGRPALPGYVSIKEAAQMLGLSDKRVYEYVDEGRLPSMWAADVIMIPLDEVQKFKRKSSGRPRKSVPAWRISSGENTQFTTFITVQIYPDQQNALMQKLEEIRQAPLYTFPGTISRLIAESKTVPGQIEISLVWRSAVMPNEIEREQAVEAFQQAFSGIFDWDTAHYYHSQVLMLGVGSIIKQRLYVSVSRAKQRLFLVGDEDTFKKNKSLSQSPRQLFTEEHHAD